MAIKQSAYFKGNARTPVPHPHRKGETLTFIFTHTFTEALADTDVLELFPIFPYGRIVSFEFTSANIGTAALDIGLMSGDAGSLDAARTSDDVLIDGVAANASTGTKTALADIAAIAMNGETAVSVGVKTATTIAAASNKTLTVLITVVS